MEAISVGFPAPVPGLVIRYAYLWRSEHRRGLEEGVKDRPRVVILSALSDDGEEVVTVLPVTHTPPSNDADALEIPTKTKRRLALDDERSWIVVAEANEFVWPGPDLRPSRAGELGSIAYGSLPQHLFLSAAREVFTKAQCHRETNGVKRLDP